MELSPLFVLGLAFVIGVIALRAGSFLVDLLKRRPPGPPPAPPADPTFSPAPNPPPQPIDYAMRAIQAVDQLEAVGAAHRLAESSGRYKLGQHAAALGLALGSDIPAHSPGITPVPAAPKSANTTKK